MKKKIIKLLIMICSVILLCACAVSTHEPSEKSFDSDSGLTGKAQKDSTSYVSIEQNDSEDIEEKNPPEPDLEALNPPVPTDGYISEYTTYVFEDDSHINYTETKHAIYNGQDTVVSEESYRTWQEDNVEIRRHTITQQNVTNIIEYRSTYDEEERIIKKDSYSNGVVSSHTDYTYNSSGELIREEEQNSYERTVEEYERGLLVRRISYGSYNDEPDVETGRYEYTYDAEGNKKEEYYYQGGVLSKRSEWYYFDDDLNKGRKQKTEYDASGRISRMDGFDSHGNYDYSWYSDDYISYTLTKYDGDKKISKRTISLHPGQFNFSEDHRFFYSEGGKKIREVEYNSDGSTSTCTIFFYDEKGRCVREETYHDSTTFNLTEKWNAIDLYNEWIQQASVHY